MSDDAPLFASPPLASANEAGRAQATEGVATAEVGLISDFCVDLVLAGDVHPQFGQAEQLLSGYTVELGGSANIFACQLAKLGRTVSLRGVAGADLLGEFALKRLSDEGVSTAGIAIDAQTRTALTVALLDGEDRSMLTYSGSIAAATEALLPQVSAIPAHWHIASPYLLPALGAAQWRPFLETARRAGTTVSLDPNWDPAGDWSLVRDLVDLLDVFLPNEQELAAIAGIRDPREAAVAMAALGPLVVVKRGAEGPFAATPAGEIVELSKALRGASDAAADAIGAGDSFDAGFMDAWLGGLALTDCLHRGHLCGRASVSRHGGVAGQIGYRDLPRAGPTDGRPENQASLSLNR